MDEGENGDKAVYTNNQSPLRENPYIELPLGSVKARGWLKEMLIRQKEGSTGHMDELYPKVMGESNGWLGGNGDQWERGPYWIHGLITLAYTLEDQELIDKTTPWIEWILDSQKPSGYFGPDKDFEENLPGVQRTNAADWWPRMVVLKILKQYYSATQDERVIELMTSYFKYQLETLPEKPLDNWTFWARYRGGDNLMIVYWLYNITGDKFLLELADLIHEQTFDYTYKFLETRMLRNNENIHCVNLAQGIKEPAIYYQQHPEEKYINAIKKAFADIKEFSGQPQGMYGGDEALRNNKPTNGVELCSVVEMMYSLETILEITGEVQIADHLERVAYNALPAQITDDFMNRQYFQQANQVKVTRAHRNFSLNHDGTDVCFGFLTGYPCCTSNMHQGWPIFIQNSWYATADGGLAALFYAPTQVTAKVGDDNQITVIEETNYPFEDNIRFQVNIPEDKNVNFPLKLRIPEWCQKASVLVNGEQYAAHEGNQVITIDRKWADGDELNLKIPAEIELNRWHERSVSVDRGPLNFVLKIDENWEKVKNTKDPERYGDYYYEVTPESPWNYGLIDVPEEEIQEHYEIIKKQNTGSFPWNKENTPVEIKTKAKRIKDWKLYNESAGPLPYSIQYGQRTGEEETVTLIPYGCSALRISEFPLAGDYSVMR
ncbi:MAG: beta-L-arabinofuranosidase domain-containing protein [Bacteroidales bacterium]